MIVDNISKQIRLISYIHIDMEEINTCVYIKYYMI